MDVVFDIDGTLANASHRLHLITDPEHFVIKDGLPKPDWESFLAPGMTSKDTPIEPIWEVLNALHRLRHRILFITARPERERDATYAWLTRRDCTVRGQFGDWHHQLRDCARPLSMYMRADGDRRPSEVVKRESLQKARTDGYDPVLVFEDRVTDTAMWRSEGLLCCQVAEGN